MRRPLVARVLGVLGLVLLASTVVTLLFGSAQLVVGKLALGLAALAAAVLLGGQGGVKRFFTGRAAHFGFFTALSGLLVVAILVAANYVAWARPKTWDFTRSRIFTLSEDTTRTLAALDLDVHAVAFYQQADGAYEATRALLARYAGRTRRFTWELVDPYRAPDLVRRYGIVEAGPRIVLVAGAKEARVKEPTEEALTNGLVELGRGAAKKVYFVGGHGEPAPDDRGDKGYGAAADALRKDGFEVAGLSLLGKGEVPADATVVLVAGARKALLDPEVKALEAFLARGGKVGLYLEPEVDAGLDGLMKAFGIEADRDMVVDPSPVSRLFGGSPVTPIVAPVETHPIAKDLRNVGVALPTARSLVALSGAPVTPQPVLLTSEAAWGETDVDSLFKKGAKRDPGEKGGPLPVAMSAAKAGGGGKGEARLLVVGDSEFLDDRYQQVLGNLDFFLNGVAWLAERPDRITIRPRTREGSRLFLTEAQVAGIRFVTVDAIPVALLALGLGVWMVRRSR